MTIPRQVAIPTLVRVKPGAIDRLGIYAGRHGFRRVVLLQSEGLPETLPQRVRNALETEGIELLATHNVTSASFEEAVSLFQNLPAGTEAVIGLGGGKALDVAKYAGFLARLPFVSVPGSLSNDGFCSPQSSLTLNGRRRSLPAVMPFGVVLDTAVCLAAPESLWLSGVGDLAAKFTAVTDWKLAFHARGTPVDDFAALLSDASVFQFLAHPVRDLEGIRLLGTALMLNGIAMGICGSSRPASGSEHLISHALDEAGARPRLHGLQVGVATYLVSHLQGRHTELIGGLFDTTGFWRAIEADPFVRSEWLAAARRAPRLKPDFHTVLSERDCLPEVARLLSEDSQLRRVFID
ncbi:MAG TPA: dehydrogenase [Verrucomicrobiales bacterium]|nr:dehydrogenase [Verrucomicrobiales bacterium]